MGLAPYGTPTYERRGARADRRRRGRQLPARHGLLRVSLRPAHDQRHASTASSAAPRAAEAPLEQRHKDIAASVQKVTEDVMLKMARHLHRETGLRNLCLAGGVALNCVANGRIAREGPFDDLFVQPAAGDAGGALGVAAYIQHHVFEQPRDFVMRSAFLGPGLRERRDPRVPRGEGRRLPGAASARRCSPARAAAIADQEVVGWFQGRMEFGPRALGVAQHPGGRRAIPRIRTASISRSSSARASGRSRPRCWPSARASTSSWIARARS